MTTFNSEAVKSELNQYWYSTVTIDTLLSEVVHHASRCAFLSTPSLYFALGSKTPPSDASDDEKTEHQRALTLRANSKLFEYDRQWQSDANYVFYDFQKPEQIPIQYLGYFDYVVVDPPFITSEVWAKYAETIKLIIKRTPEADGADTQGSGAVRDCLGGGKVLFTTVLENHTMLEGLINGPLFIPRFRPYVCNLVYQYVCFLNYDATRLQHANPEVPEDDAESRKLWAAIGMANDIRHSETAFALQMEQRDREGEAPLPTLAHERDVLMGIVDADGNATGKDLASVPISAMRWSYVPEGLTMYPGGDTPNEACGAAAEMDPEDFGPCYAAALTLRTELNDFKGRIDSMQKHMDAQMKLRLLRGKLAKERQQLCEQEKETQGEKVAALTAAMETVSQEIEESEAARAARLDEMSALAANILASERRLAVLKATESGTEEVADGQSVPYEAAMADCVAAYQRVEVKRTPLQELAADATRKYKSPLFSRMKELLQEMKDVKKNGGCDSKVPVVC